LERVIIGRSEILTPGFEAKLLAEGGMLPSKAKDKYYLAYLDFLAKAKAQATRILPGARVTGKGPQGAVFPGEGSATPAFHVPGSAGRVFDARGRVGEP
jgi:hypothetical protein